jgi:hypothetical protein
VGSGQWAAGNGQQAIDSGQQAAGSVQQAVCSRQCAAGSGHMHEVAHCPELVKKPNSATNEA